jgi:transposase
MAAKYVVTLTREERQELTAIVGKGRAAARKIAHARILLQADAAPGAPAWGDERIVEALGVSPATVHRVRRAFVEHGPAAALERRRPTGRQYRKLDGRQEAHLVALACSTPPPGRRTWTMKLLADRLVELEVVGSLSAECVRTTLKKTSSSPGSKTSG